MVENMESKGDGSAGKRICFLVGSIALSGGTYVIVQHASYLQDRGFDVTLAVQHPFDADTLAWHDAGRRLRCVPISVAYQESFDLVIATWWKTALELAAFKTPRHAYFVQSIESRFYPEQERPLRALVDATYHLPVSYITEARWIVDHLDRQFGQQAAYVRNGIRKDIYTPDGLAEAPRPGGQPRVLIEGHFNVRFKNTGLAVKLARQAGARDIWVMTGSPVGQLPGISRVSSRIPISETPRIYRSCDILVKLSTVEGMFGPPLEMFHCGGTAIVFDVTGHDEYIRADENAVVVRDRNMSKVVSELRDLLANRERLNALKAGAVATARNWPDWSQSSAAFEQWVGAVLAASETDRNAIEAITRAAWDSYRIDEQERLRKSSAAVVWRQRAERLAGKLPGGMQDRIRQLRVLGEVLLPPSKVS